MAKTAHLVVLVVVALAAACGADNETAAAPAATQGVPTALAPTAALSAQAYLERTSARAACVADTTSKLSCLFNNVCLLSRDTHSLSVVLARGGSPGMPATATGAQLRQLLDTKSAFGSIDFFTSPQDAAAAAGAHPLALAVLVNGSAGLGDKLVIDHAPTVLWRSAGYDYSFGHLLINTIFPLFLVLSNHFGEGADDIPRHLQLLIAPKIDAGPMHHMLTGMVAPDTHSLTGYLARVRESGKAGVCFRNFLLGDGGYIDASLASLANSGREEAKTYGTKPSFFSSRNWLAFRRHAMQVSGILPEGRGRPLVLLNDKRYHSRGQLATDRRMILEIDALADQIRHAYPVADVVVVRFRDISWADQLHLLSSAAVFITTQGSSAFRLVFLPPGSTCVMLGAPEAPGETEWKAFHELDRWFPLSYVTFHRYAVNIDSKEEYSVRIMPGHWQPAGEDAARRWWLYNADVRVKMDRLKPLLDAALGSQAAA